MRSRICIQALVLAMSAAVATGCTKQGKVAQFAYEKAKFGATLAGPNFEYVKFGAVGEASIPLRLEHMKATDEIGLVNEALSKVLGQGPRNAPIALVNVVVDISREITFTSHTFGAPTTETVDDYLVIRADIVRFTKRLPASERNTRPPATPAAPGADGLQSHVVEVDLEVAALADRLRVLRGDTTSSGREAYRAHLKALTHRIVAQRSVQRAHM